MQFRTSSEALIAFLIRIGYDDDDISDIIDGKDVAKLVKADRAASVRIGVVEGAFTGLNSMVNTMNLERQLLIGLARDCGASEEQLTALFESCGTGGHFESKTGE